MKAHHINLPTSLTAGIASVVLVITLLMSPLAYATEYSFNDTGEIENNNSAQVEAISSVIITIIHTVSALLAVVAIVSLIVGGVLVGTAAGRENRAHTGRKLLLAGGMLLFCTIVSWLMLWWTSSNITQLFL